MFKQESGHQSHRVTYVRHTAQDLASGAYKSNSVSSLFPSHRLLLLGSREKKLTGERDWVGDGYFLLLLPIFCPKVRGVQSVCPE